MKIGIVGAGIAGSYLSYKLSKDHDVTIFEAKKALGNKACSGLVSERLWNYVPKNNKLVKNKISKIVIHFDKKDVTLNLYPKMIVVNRDELDKYVLSKSKAKIKLNSPIRKLDYEKGGKPVLHTAKGKFEFDYVIGADGAKSMIRKSIGGKDPKFNLGIFTYDKKRDKSDVVDVWPLKNGFAWKIPRGDSVEYGVFERPNVAFKEFKKFYKKKPKIVYSAIIPDGYVNVAKERVTVVGDAAGLAKPWSGGGIIWTLKSTEFLLDSFPNFKKYDRGLKEFFEPRIFFSRKFSKLGKWLGKHAPWMVPKEVYFDSDWIF